MGLISRVSSRTYRKKQLRFHKKKMYFKPSALLLILPAFFTLTSASIKILHAIDNNDFTLRHDFKLNQIAANTYGITKNQKTFKKTKEDSKYKIKLELPSGRTYQTWVSYTKLQEGC